MDYEVWGFNADGDQILSTEPYTERTVAIQKARALLGRQAQGLGIIAEVEVRGYHADGGDPTIEFDARAG